MKSKLDKLDVDNLVPVPVDLSKLSDADKIYVVKKAEYNELTRINERINSNKIKHVLVENESSELSKNVEAISTKGLTKDLKNGYKILNGARYFSSGILQSHLIYFLYKRVLSWKSIALSEESIEKNNYFRQQFCFNFK